MAIIQLRDPVLEGYLEDLESDGNTTAEYIAQNDVIISNAIRIIDIPYTKWTNALIFEFLKVSEMEHNERRQMAFDLARKNKKIPPDAEFEYLPFSVETKILRIAILHAFFKYLRRKKIVPFTKIDFYSIRKNVRGIPKERISKKDRYYVPFEMLKHFIERAPEQKFAAMFWLSYLQYMNLKDIIALKWGDIDFFKDEITFYKNRSKRIVKRKSKLTRLARDFLYDYLVEFRFNLPLRNIRESLKDKRREDMDVEEQQIYNVFYNRSNEIFLLSTCDLDTIASEPIFPSKENCEYASVRSLHFTLERMNMASKDIGLPRKITSRVLVASGVMENSIIFSIEELHMFTGLRIGTLNDYIITRSIEEVKEAINQTR